jgi:transposase-like protein
MAKKKRRARKLYSAKQRAGILAAARKEGLTAEAVQKKFGVTPVTYYSWRRKAGVGTHRSRRGRQQPPGVLESGVNLVEAVRAELRSQIQRVLPDLVRTEVGAALLGTTVRRGRRQR